MNYYKVDQKYKFSNRKGNKDQFIDWFNDKTNISFTVMGGIRQRVFRSKNFKAYGLPSLIVLFEVLTNKGSEENPWKPALFDNISGKLAYPGDGKENNLDKETEQFAGNKIFLKCNEAQVEGNEQLIPPILFFKTYKEGWSEFKGVFKFKKIKKYYDDNARFDNYEYHCQRLAIDKVSINWLRDRALCNNLSQLDNDAPLEWKNRYKIIQFSELRAAH